MVLHFRIDIGQPLHENRIRGIGANRYIDTQNMRSCATNSDMDVLAGTNEYTRYNG